MSAFVSDVFAHAKYDSLLNLQNLLNPADEEDEFAIFYFESVPVVIQAESSFLEINHMYEIYHPEFIKKQSLHIDTILSDITISLLQAKLEQKVQIRTFFYAPEAKYDATIAKINSIAEILESLSGTKALLSSAQLRRKLRDMIAVESNAFQCGFKEKEVKQKIVEEAKKLDHYLDLLYRETSFELFNPSLQSA